MIERALLGWLFLFLGPRYGQTLSSISLDALKGKNILVVGGSGRVGGSVVTQLIQRGSYVCVGGTNLDHFHRAKKRWGALFPSSVSQIANIPFVVVNRERADTLQDLRKYDLVVHTAGPFQGKVTIPNGVLEACIDASVPYIDVCDDYCTASAAKARYGSKASAPCILSTGTWPGVSSLMAKQLASRVLAQYPRLSPADLSVDFAFFTAGSGGAGVTLIVATFLILAEQALIVVRGRRKTVPPLQGFTTCHFGTIVGDRAVAPLNLLETASIHDYLGIGSTSAKFGTAPSYWNTLLALFGNNVPKRILENENLMRNLSAFSMPIIRIVDYFAGAANAIRVDVSVVNDTKSDMEGHLATAIYAHENLEPNVGECIVAFAAAVLSGSVRPGVWFPEEAIQGGDDAGSVLALASVGAHTTQVDGMGLSREDIFGQPLPSPHGFMSLS